MRTGGAVPQGLGGANEHVPSGPEDGERRTNATHASLADSDALLDKKAKGHEAKLSYLGHVLIEHRHGLVVNTRLTRATGRAEWEAAWAMAKAIPGRRRATLGDDRHYDDRGFVESLCTLNVTPTCSAEAEHRVPSPACSARVPGPPLGRARSVDPRVRWLYRNRYNSEDW
jgi:hypothetical protein